MAKNSVAGNRRRQHTYYERFKSAHGMTPAQARRLRDPRSKMQEALVQCRKRAKQRGLACDITIDEIALPDTCPILQIPLDYAVHGRGKAQSNSPSLDRIDNSRGYIKGNVRIISHRANTLKSAFNDPAIFRRVADYMEGKL